MKGSGHPYVVRQSTNNGVKGYINEDIKFLNEGNTISFGQDTATVFYQDKPYFTGDKIKVLKPKEDGFNRLNASFFLALINRAFSSFTWGAQSFSIATIESQTISMPITKGDKIDYHFMESFVRELEAYLIATGLSDYNLTTPERKALSDFIDYKWKDFRIGDLFERVKTNKLTYKAKELPQHPDGLNTLPCLTSSFMNQGLNYYTQRKGATILKNVISIPSNSDVYRAYYQPNDFTVLSDAYAIQWKDHNYILNSKHYLFLVTCINKVTDLPIYSYKNKMGGWNVVKDKEITLPVTSEGKLDLEAMALLTSAIQKVVIEKVARHTDKRLEVARKVINSVADSSSFHHRTERNSTRDVIPIYNHFSPGRLPLYSIRAACGYFNNMEIPEAEGWIDASGYGFTPDKDRFFAVYAKGNSMFPRIQDGDICVFEWYIAGSRNGEIVLSQSIEDDIDYGGKYTIKKYYSEKVVTEEGWEHTGIQLQSLNPDYQSIDISQDNARNLRTIGILKAVIHK